MLRHGALMDPENEGSVDKLNSGQPQFQATIVWPLEIQQAPDVN